MEASGQTRESFDIRLAGRKLANRDFTSSSDARVNVFIGDSPQDTTSTFIGSTEVVKDNSNPNFQTAIVIRYFPDKNEEIRFAVDDVDDGKNDLIGEAKVLVHALVEALEARKSIELELFRSGQSAGFLTVTPDRTVEPLEYVAFEVFGKDLEKKDLFGKSDPYLLFHGGETFEGPVFLKTPVRKNTLNPNWGIMQFRSISEEYVLCIECYDWNKLQKHEFIGRCTVKLSQLREKASNRQAFHVPLVNPKKAAKSSKYTNSGTIVFSNFHNPRPVPSGVTQCLAQAKCTYTVTERKHQIQPWYRCKTCNWGNDIGCCKSCRDVCHPGHETEFVDIAAFYCDCAEKDTCRLMHPAVPMMSPPATSNDQHLALPAPTV